jgi:two-component sensor histidine kinase
MSQPLPPKTPSASRDFLSGGGEMGALIRDFEWSKTPLGAPETWPPSLRTTVRLMLNSRHPMFIWWGPELIQLYNDAYRETMGPEMHPSALGARGRDSWAAIWPIIGPQIELVMDSKGSTWNVEQMVPINRHGGIQEVWWTYGYSPIDLEGSVGGVLVVCTDVTQQHLTTEALRDSTQRLAQQFESAPGFIAIMRGPQHVFELTNASYRRLIGNREAVGRPVREALPDIAGQGFYELLDQVYQTGKTYVGRRTPILLQTEGSDQPQDLFLDFVYQPIIESNGQVSGIFVQGQDVTDHVLAESRLKLINSELRHRVRNTLAMVGAVAGQTFRDPANKASLASFEARLAAFGAADEAIVGAQPYADLVDVVQLALKPHIPGPDRYIIDGPSVTIGPKQAVSLALALHELATNAAKYGALSTPTGRVRLSWSVAHSAPRDFRFEWREEGGPQVVPPARKGFGSRLVNTVMANDFGGVVTVDYAPSGVVLTMVSPAASLLGPEQISVSESGTGSSAGQNTGT